jgi:hypothetical protein
MGRGVERSLASGMDWGLHALGAEAALDCAPADDAPEALPCVSEVVIVGVEAARAGAATAVAEARRAGDAVSGPPVPPSLPLDALVVWFDAPA